MLTSCQNLRGTSAEHHNLGSRTRVYEHIQPVSLYYAVSQPRPNSRIASWSAALPSLLGSRLMLSMREAVYRRAGPDSYIMETFSTPVSLARSPPYNPHRRAPWEDSDADADTVEFSGGLSAEQTSFSENHLTY